MTYIMIVFALMLSACSGTLDRGRPGDEQAQAWVRPWPACTETKQLECPEPGARYTITESCVELADCELSKLTIRGEHGATVNDIEPAGKTRAPGYVDWIRDDSPHDIVVRDVTIDADGYTTGLFVGSGVTYAYLRSVRVSGAKETQVYVAAESSRIELNYARIDASGASRCAIAFDSSDYFALTQSKVDGCVETYRNEGENWRTRHTTSSYGVLAGNEISGDVLIGSREGDRGYGWQDYRRGGPGSSGDDRDWSREVELSNNEIGGDVVVGETSSVVTK